MVHNFRVSRIGLEPQISVLLNFADNSIIIDLLNVNYRLLKCWVHVIRQTYLPLNRHTQICSSVLAKAWKRGTLPLCVQSKATPLIKKFLFHFHSAQTPAQTPAQNERWMYSVQIVNAWRTGGKRTTNPRKTDDKSTKNGRQIHKKRMTNPRKKDERTKDRR